MAIRLSKKQEYLYNYEESIFFTGPTGTGKTVSAIMAMIYHIEQWHTAGKRCSQVLRRISRWNTGPDRFPAVDDFHPGKQASGYAVAGVSQQP